MRPLSAVVRGQEAQVRISRLIPSVIVVVAVLAASGLEAVASPAQAAADAAGRPGVCVPANSQPLRAAHPGLQAVPTEASSVSGWLTCPLGEHVFGQLRDPDAVVARADSSQVGFHPGREGVSYGPWSFDVAPDGSIWLVDVVNDRLVSWAPGAPDHPRYLPLPVGTTPIDIAVTAQGTIYVTAIVQGPYYAYALTRAGQVLWKAPLAATIMNSPLRIGPDGVPYLVTPGDTASWTPLTSPSGHPLTLAEQRSRTTTYQPLPGGRRLTAGPEGPRERRFTLATSTGRTVRVWQVTSRTDLGGVISTPELVGDDLAVTIEVARQTPTQHLWEIEALRLPAAGGEFTRYAVDARAVWGDDVTRLRVAADHALYALRTSPLTGATIGRYSLRPGTTPGPRTPAPTAAPRPKDPNIAPAATSGAQPSTPPPSQVASTAPSAGTSVRDRQPGPSTPWLATALAAAAAVAGCGYWLLRRRPRTR
jgi:hypothetical protein